MCITGEEKSYKWENKLYKRYPIKQEQITRNIIMDYQTLKILGLDHVYFNTLKFTSVYYDLDFGYRILLILRFVFCLILFNFMEVIIVSINYFAILTFI